MWQHNPPLHPTVTPQSGARMTRQRAAGERGGGESRSEGRDTEHVGKREQRDCLAPGASLFTAGTNLNAGLTKLSTDKRAHARGLEGGTVRGALGLEPERQKNREGVKTASKRKKKRAFSGCEK